MDAQSAGSGDRPTEPGESEKERVDRNMKELLEGIRVALPGVQVLFAFLLILPFQVGFEAVTEFQKDVYFGTLVATTIALILLIGPSVRHRVLFRHGDKKWVLLTGNRLAGVGMAFLGVAVSGAILLICDVLFSLAAAIVASGAVAVALVWIWFGAPWLRSAR